MRAAPGTQERPAPVGGAEGEGRAAAVGSLGGIGGSLGRVDVVPLGAGAGIAAVGVALVLVMNGSYNGLAITTGLGYAVVTVGMVVQLGYSHQLAFSQSAFMGVGAYGVALLETRYGFGVPEAILAVIVVSALVALVSGSVVTRAPGLALALATVLLPVLLYQLATFSHYLGSFTGISGVGSLWSGGSYQGSLVGSGVVLALVLGLVTVVAWRILRSSVGLQLGALAEDEAMAEAVGVGLRRRKLELFVLGSVLAALGGALVASVQGLATPDIVSVSAELTLLVMLFIGGRRSIPAAIVGAVGIEWLSTRAQVVSSNLLILEGVLLLGVLLFEPEGLAGLTQRLARWALARRGGGGLGARGGTARTGPAADLPGASPATVGIGEGADADQG
ncbi:MAG TPA: branched-chain amino acid ABC transporter permease [Acidimicrobiales bacterium]|nr:branched-chain amino acid ABC transporter permease [Acidimicrobiales bacterium]